MSDKHHDTFITDQDWIRLRQWSEGYDAGWNGVQISPSPADFFDRGEYVAGFVRGKRDRREIEREQPH